MAKDSKTTGTFAEWEESSTQINKAVKGFRPRPQRAHLLIQIEGPGEGRRIVLGDDMITLGRAASSDVQLESDDVSRTHARLTRVDDEYTVEDLESRNGIFLNGLAVHAAVLRDGDELQVGDLVFAYQEGA